MNPEDLRINTYTSGINCPVAVKVIHLPTGMFAEHIASSKLVARERAMAELERRVDELESA